MRQLRFGYVVLSSRLKKLKTKQTETWDLEFHDQYVFT